jgi:hypothetical protein
MHDALGNPLAIKMRELLDQVMVLHQNRSSRTRGPRVLIVGDRGSAIRCENVLGFHHSTPTGCHAAAEIQDWADSPPHSKPRWLPNPDWLKRFVNLLLIDLLPALHARHDLFDLVALLPKGGVILVTLARFALRSIRGLLQIGDRLCVRLG